VILDVMLPLMNGFETLSHLRQFSVPVLMLTARGNPMDVAVGFRIGSDDYLAKPFIAEELALRIQAIIRRTNQEEHGRRRRPLCLRRPVTVRRSALVMSS